jgi:hypothetical protein
MFQNVHQLESRATAAQHYRDDAVYRCDVAEHRYRQPNRYIWRNQVNALLVAACLSLGGVGVALGQGAPTWGVLGTGAGVAVGLVSKRMDDDRQTWEKEDQLLAAQRRLQQAEQALQEAVQAYQAAEEARWLMLALDLNPSEFQQFRDWMADPRRSMKDAVLEAVDLLAVPSVLGLSLADPKLELDKERKHRVLKHKLTSPEFQLTKDAFMATIAAKHTLQRQQEQAENARDMLRQTVAVSAGGAATLGMAAGAAAADWIANTVTAFDGSKSLATTLATIGGAATVVGVGVVAAGAIASILFQSEKERQRQEEQRFQAAFTITQNIYDTVTKLCALPEGAARQELVSQLRTKIVAFQQRELKSQDQQLQEFVRVLQAQLEDYGKQTPCS